MVFSNPGLHKKRMEVQLLGPDSSTMLEVICWKSMIFKDIRVAIVTPGTPTE